MVSQWCRARALALCPSCMFPGLSLRPSCMFPGLSLRPSCQFQGYYQFGITVMSLSMLQISRLLSVWYNCNVCVHVANFQVTISLV